MITPPCENCQKYVPHYKTKVFTYFGFVEGCLCDKCIKNPEKLIQKEIRNRIWNIKLARIIVKVKCYFWNNVGVIW